MTLEQFEVLIEKNPRIKKDDSSVLAKRLGVSEETIKEFRKRIKEKKKQLDLDVLNTPSLEQLEQIAYRQEANNRVPIAPNGYVVSSFQLNKDNQVQSQWLKLDENKNNQLDIESIDYKSEFKQALKELKLVKPIVTKTKSNGNLLIVNCLDVHLNKKYAENPSSLEEQIILFKEAIEYNINEALLLGSLEKIVLHIGHDFFNSEATGMTTRGTPQNNLVPHHVLFKEALKAMIYIVEYCTSITNLDIVWVEGNHATHSEKQLVGALDVYYDSNNKVNILSSDLERQYYSWRNNAFMLVHDLKKKYVDIPVIFALEAPVMFAECKNRVAISGHLHGLSSKEFQTSQEKFGVIWLQAPALSGTCKWSNDNMYIGNKQRMLGLVIDPEKGIKNHIYFTK